jgi:hypothetical protein
MSAEDAEVLAVSLASLRQKGEVITEKLKVLKQVRLQDKSGE